MDIYYAVKVKYSYDTENGMKSKSEYALVPAISISDAETKATKHYAEVLQFHDVSVISAAPSVVSTVVGLKSQDKPAEE